MPPAAPRVAWRASPRVIYQPLARRPPPPLPRVAFVATAAGRHRARVADRKFTPHQHEEQSKDYIMRVRKQQEAQARRQAEQEMIRRYMPRSLLDPPTYTRRPEDREAARNVEKEIQITLRFLERAIAHNVRARAAAHQIPGAEWLAGKHEALLEAAAAAGGLLAGASPTSPMVTPRETLREADVAHSSMRMRASLDGL